MDEEPIIYPPSPYEKSPWKDIRLAAIAKEVRFDNERMYVRLVDEREISVPIKWFPVLLHATPEQRDGWELAFDGRALHWEEINEYVSIRGLLRFYK